MAHVTRHTEHKRQGNSELINRLVRIALECLKRQKKQTAEERYADHRRNIVALVGLLCEELDAHREKASREPNEWGFPSDLGYVHRSLKDVMLFLIAPRFESKAEAARFIESYIEAFNRGKPEP